MSKTSTTSRNQGDKNWFQKHKIATGFLGFIGFIVIVSALSSDGDQSSESQQNTNTSGSSEEVVEASQESPKEEKKEPEYQEVFTFSGNGTKKSEPFTITGNRFKIEYDCNGDLCQAMLYKANGSLEGLVMNTTGSVKDETIQYGKGEYYIDANTIGEFSFKVYDYK